MAHAARVSELTDGLVRSVSGDRQHQSLRRMREQAAKSFRDTSHSRTNQFDIQSRLTGLVEKFAVLNREDLSEALQSRLDELPENSKWMPEILSLLLQLSDRPLEKTDLDDVEALSKSAEADDAGLTWAELMADGPEDESGLWDNVERGYHSSGDDATVDGEADSDKTSSTLATSVEDDTIALARLHIAQPDDGLLDEFLVDENEPTQPVSELQLIKESLSMLHGLPTKLYESNMETELVTPQTGTNVQTSSRSTINDLTLELANVGSQLNSLRHWTRSRQNIAYLQSCQSAAQALLIRLGQQFSTIEQQYISPQMDKPVSVVELRSSVESTSKPALCLSRIVELSQRGTPTSPFALLDILYDEMCVAEMACDEHVVNDLSNVFFAGLKTYLRPLSKWIQTGSLNSKDSTSMIMEANPDCELGRLWYDRFAMRRLSSGKVCAPRFLTALASKVLALGKSRAFLQALGSDEDFEIEPARNRTNPIDHLHDQVRTISFLPFSQLLSDALDAWIIECSADSSPVLKQKLLHEHGLLQTIDRLEMIFCSRNGIQFQAFADALFSRMELLPEAWKHEFLLSELAQSTLGTSSRAVGQGLVIRIKDTDGKQAVQSLIRQIGAITLETTFPWPIQNITCTSSSLIHSRTFAFLLQTYRAKYLLRPIVAEFGRVNTTAKNPPHQIALSLRQHLIAFADVMHSHITASIQLIHRSMKYEMAKAADIDAMAAAWSSHMKQMDTALLLATKFTPIREAITTSLELAERFAPLWSDITAKEGSRDGDDSSSQEELYSMRAELDRSLSFIIAGVRSIGRASGISMLEELAERLAWLGN